MNETIFQLVMSGLLHDIGKIGQRAKIDLSQQTQNMQGDLCPFHASNGGGYFSHQHVLWTNQFLEEYGPILAETTGEDIGIWNQIRDLASFHHVEKDTENPLQAIIQEADCLSSGHDRKDSWDENNASGYKDFRFVPLISIFGKVKLEPKKDFSVQGVWPIPDYLNPKKGFALYPTLLTTGEHCQLSENEGGPERYKTVWDWTHQTLQHWAENYRKLSRQQLCTGLDSLGQIGWSYIPASTMLNQNDVSLYDHSRLVTALAAAMGNYHQNTNTMNIKAVRNRELQKYRFVVGTLSGIQNYIFNRSTESQRGAAKRYRARSFILSLITQIASWRILRRSGLPVFNRIIDAGGRFTLLVDNTPETLANIEKEIASILGELNREYCGRVQLHIDTGLTASGEDFVHHTVIDRYQNLKKWEADDAKLAKGIGKKLTDSISCYLIVTPNSSSGSDLSFDEKSCVFEDQLSSDMVRSISEQKGWIWSLKSDLNTPLPPAGLFNTLGHAPRWNNERTQLREKIQSYIDNDDEDDKDDKALNAQINFEELAALSLEERDGKLCGTPMIGCLKADVDHLGQIFAQGFGKDVSIGRIVTLSRQLDAFFKVNLHQLLDYHHYVIFAGGDDLFLVGTWDEILTLIQTLHEKFTKYVCQNPNITFSAGIVFGKPKSPISQLGDAAEEELTLAKNAGRNRIRVVNRIFEWAQYDDAFKQTLSLYQSAEELSTTFIYRLHLAEKQAYEIHEKSHKPNHSVPKQNLLWRSHLTYDIARNLDDKPDVRDKIEKLTQYVTSTELMLPAVRLATTYLLYKTRS